MNIKEIKSPKMDLKKIINEFISKNKYPLIITLGFFLIVSYITFFHHNYWFEYDGIYYLNQGDEILRGNGENTQLFGATSTGPVIYSTVNSIIGNGFLTLKLFALFGGTIIIFTSYFIVRNIFNEKIAIMSQLLIAVNARFLLLSTWSLNEQLPLLFIFLSLFFITKKELKIKEVIVIGILLGISFAIRYQALFVFIAFLIFLLIRNKNYKNNLIQIGLITLIFLIVASPLFAYNYSTHGTIMDSNPNFYMLQSKFQTPEWRDEILENTIKNENTLAIFLDFNLFIKNYFYNLFYHNPNHFFNFDTWVSLSIIPIVPYIGIIPMIIGTGYILKIKITKIYLSIIFGSIFVTGFIITIWGEIENHFFALVIIPMLIIGIIQIKKIEKQVLPLLILSVVCFFGISILPVIRGEQLFFMWITIPILTSICFVEIVPQWVSKLNEKYSKIKKSHVKITITLILIILIINIGFSYRTGLVYFYDDMPEDINTEILKLTTFEPRNQAGTEIKVISDILSKQPGIENSYIMSDSVAYSYYSNSKFLFTSFQEGKKGDSINSFILRENWSDYEIYYSNLNSDPPNRTNENKPIPDYLIFHKLNKVYSDNPEDMENNQYHDLIKILDPRSSKVPNNFELLYINNQTSTVVYKIHENE